MFSALQIVKSKDFMSHFEQDWFEIANIAIVLLVLLAQVVFVFWIDCFLYVNHDQMKLDNFRALFGTLYSRIQIDNRAASFLTGFSFKRRLLLIASLVLIQDYNPFQLFLNIYVQGIMAIYVIKVRPMFSKIDNFVIICNEVGQLLTLHLMVVCANMEMD